VFTPQEKDKIPAHAGKKHPSGEGHTFSIVFETLFFALSSRRHEREDGRLKVRKSHLERIMKSGKRGEPPGPTEDRVP
jgi:hypothetical protein